MHSITGQLNRYRAQPRPAKYQPQLQPQLTIPTSKSNIALLNQKLLKQAQQYTKRRQDFKQSLERPFGSSRSGHKYQRMPLHPDAQAFAKIQERQRKKESIHKYKITSLAEQRSSSRSSTNNLKSALVPSGSLKRVSKQSNSMNHDYDSLALIQAKKQMEKMVFVTDRSYSDQQDPEKPCFFLHNYTFEQDDSRDRQKPYDKASQHPTKRNEDKVLQHSIESVSEAIFVSKSVSAQQSMRKLQDKLQIVGNQMLGPLQISRREQSIYYSFRESEFQSFH